MKISVLQHAANEGPGEIARWAEERGHAIGVHHLYRGEAFPEMETFDLLVVMGGEMNIYQDRDYPWLKDERDFISSALEKARPLVGICLGAQFIADALGARVTQNLVHEIGWFSVNFTAEGRGIFSALPASTPALHWHGDTFELPARAVRLGSSEACPEQGFVIPGRCLGLQFHFETDAPLVGEMVEGSSDFALWPKGDFVQPPEMILEGAKTNCVLTRPLLFHLLDTFCAGMP